ncbi:transposase [Pelagibacterium sp.]|uniref:transposase n=1 Tax=Pelagibacterium sp. TaxID=1967288 RepID=UPI003A8F0FA2
MTVVIGVVIDVSNASGGDFMRYEVMTGVERRRRWTGEEKLSVLGQVGVDGETVASIARRHDITRQHIYQWRREMRRKGLVSARRAAPMELAASRRQPNGCCGPKPADYSAPAFRR